MTALPTPDPMEDFRRQVLRLTPDQLDRFCVDNPDLIDVVEACLSGAELARYQQEIDPGADWRATPATMAHHLTGGARRLFPHYALLAHLFVDALEGRDPHQIWAIASQYFKTSLLMDAVIWTLDRDPTKRIMYVSYDANKAVEEGGQARDFAIEHADVLNFTLRNDYQARGRWKTDQGGGLYCVGVRGGIRGFPVDVLLLDDLFSGWQDAHSQARRDYVWNVYRASCRFRMQRTTDPIIAAGTRTHEDDVQARLVRSSEDPDADQWTVVRLPTVAEAHDPESPDPWLRVPDPLGRQPGELLAPDRFDAVEVGARRAVAGPYLWNVMEQQRPGPEEGNEILREWWRIDEDVPPAFDQMLTSWDVKLKDKESGDYVVGGTWGRTGSSYWLLAVLRGQWNQPTVENAIALAAVREPRCRTHVIENTGNGPEVMAMLRSAHPDYVISDEIAGLLGMTVAERAEVQEMRRQGMAGLIPENVKGDKTVRIRAYSGLIEAGNVHLWARAPWLPAYLDEMSAFPRGQYDDQVDMTSQALKRLTRGQAHVSAPQGDMPKTPITLRSSAQERIGRVSRYR